MNPSDITTARTTLGRQWGLGRDVTRTELGRLLGVKAQRIDKIVGQWEVTNKKVSSLLKGAINALLKCRKPPDNFIMDKQGGRNVLKHFNIDMDCYDAQGNLTQHDEY